MREGLIFKNDELIYYRDDHPHHAGVVKVDGDIYYIGSKGRAVKGVHIVHQDMSNGILKRGTYTFGEDYKLVEGSYIAPKEDKRHKHKSRHHRSDKHHHSRSGFHFSPKRLLLPCACILLVLAIIIALYHLEYKPQPVKEPSEDSGKTQSAAKIVLPDLREDILLCSQAAKLEYDGQLDLESAVSSGNPYRAFRFPYSLSADTATLLVSEDASFTSPQFFSLTNTADSIAIDNLKTNTQYYYKVIIDGEELLGSFKTAPSTRFLSIPGIQNVRDIGGYVTQDGKTVKQGVLIRGGETDGLTNAAYYIPGDQLDTVQRTFGFAYEMDLRSAGIYSGDYTSRLGIPHSFYNAPSYGSIFNQTNQSALQQIFTDLANPQNYPMYLHCGRGTDQTGTIVFLLQGILNMSEADMLREHKLTGYAHASIFESSMEAVISGLQAYDGDTLQDKIVTFLTTDIGITQAQIESIRDIYLTE